MGGAIVNTVLVMIVVGASGAFSWLLTSAGVSSLLGKAISAIAGNKYIFLLVANLIFIFIGMFIESVAGILIVTPILLPIATHWGGPGPLWDYNGSKSGAGPYDTASRRKPIYRSSHCGDSF